MRLLLIITLFGWLVLNCAVRGVLHQDSPSSDTQVIESVPDPNDEEIRKIRTFEEWHNPYVMVERNCYELILQGQLRTATRLTLDELEDRLLKLPRERWPLGRIVGVQEITIRSRGDDEKITANVKTLTRMLASHRVRAKLWPTA